MSKETDDLIDGARDDLINASQVKIGMGNYQQVRRSYEQVILKLTNALDAINAEVGKQGAK